MTLRDEVATPPKAAQQEWPARVTEGAHLAEAISVAYAEDERPDAAELIRGWNLDPEQWEIVDGTLIVNRWQGMTSKSRGNELVWLRQYKATLRRRWTADDLPLGLRTSPVIPVKVTGRGRRKTAELPGNSWRAGLFYPDPQFGYWWDEHGAIHTIHDERCFDIRNQVLTDLRSEYGHVAMVVGAGDTIDAAHFSRFAATPNYVERTLQPTLDRTSLEWQQLRAICPDVDTERIVVLDGNHDNPRLIATLIRKGLGALIGIRQGGAATDIDPVLSIQHLTQMERSHVSYVEPFPTGRVQFNGNLGCAHGPAYSSKKGATSLKILASSSQSMLHGHTHREELIAVTLWTERGPRTYYVGSPGTFCRTDLVVPSAKTNPTSRGVPAVGMGTEDWQQGFYVVLYDTDTEGVEHFAIEHVRIWNAAAHLPSVAYWRGRRYPSSVDADGTPIESETP